MTWVSSSATQDQRFSVVQLGSKRVEYDSIHHTNLVFFFYAMVLIFLTFKYPKWKFSVVLYKHIKKALGQKAGHMVMWYALTSHIPNAISCDMPATME